MFQTSNFKLHNKNGFTLLEVLLAMAIFAIMLGIAIVVTKSFSNTVNLDNSGKIIGTNIKLAKTRSIGALNNTNYGVHFESDKIIVFAGDFFISGDPANKVTGLSDDVEIHSINLAGGGSDLVFNRLTGATDNFGTIGIRLVNNPSEEKQVVINQDGQIDYISFQTSLGSPITNARHVHYDLGWDIEDSETLRLKWTGGFGTVTNDINTAAYFNADKTEFDWYGTTEVDGFEQSLRVHGWLDGSGTILCIIRDQTEEYTLEVFFVDESETVKQITTYVAEADGTVSVTPDSFYVWGITTIK